MKYSICDVIYDVISCCALTCDMGRIIVYNKIVIENKKKRVNMEIQEIITQISI